jgi:hypothetical protein
VGPLAWMVLVGLGTVRILDGLEVTIVGTLGPAAHRVRAMAIALFYSVGTGLGGIIGP